MLRILGPRRFLGLEDRVLPVQLEADDTLEDTLASLFRLQSSDGPVEEKFELVAEAVSAIDATIELDPLDPTGVFVMMTDGSSEETHGPDGFIARVLAVKAVWAVDSRQLAQGITEVLRNASDDAHQ